MIRLLNQFLDLVKRHKILTILIIVVLIGILSLVFRLGELKVIDISPKSGSKDVLTTGEIAIFFNREVKNSERSKISIDISPKEDFGLLFSKNQLKIVPENPLKTATTYTIYVKIDGRKIFDFSFETRLFTQEQIAKEGLLQSQDDMAFGEVYKKFLTENPWYTSLPIEKGAYRIIYDFEKKSFRIRFKIAVSKDMEKNLINQALENLKKIGVPEPISYYTIKAD